MSASRPLTILGSTGSIGASTLAVVEEARSRDPEAFPILALAAGRDADRLAEQARRFGARFAAVADPAAGPALKAALAGSGVACGAGPEAVIEAAAMEAEVVMAAIVGAAGLAPTLAAVRRGATVALANKECLVCAGGLFMATAAASGATLLPVDSEHNAIFQVLDRRDRVERFTLTASGGPFRTWTRSEMARATPEQAVKHPNWSMGAKISVDSATLMNKGLEVIEAARLFAAGPELLDVLVHPQSVIHSLVAYQDGSVLAQLASPDMRVPIGHVLAWPDRMSVAAKRLDLAAIGSLTFEAPDLVRFPALGLARAALTAGAGAPTVLNAANEVAVRAFLDRKLGFLSIADVVEETLDGLVGAPEPIDLAGAAALDAEARAVAEAAWRRAAC
jgi:1-deoxy-D-xylulose-5-phosphate reductoisomerase